MSEVKIITIPVDQLEVIVSRAVNLAMREHASKMDGLASALDQNTTWLKEDRAATYLGVVQKTVSNLRKRGKIKGEKRNRFWYYEKSELDRYLKEG